MTVAELLPFVNLLLVPTLGLLAKITNQLATLTAIQSEHARRLDRLDSDVQSLR